MTKLPYKVECKSLLPCFETVPAFDCETAAVCYAGECALGNPRYSYQVKYRGKVLKPVFGPGS